MRPVEFGNNIQHAYANIVQRTTIEDALQAAADTMFVSRANNARPGIRERWRKVSQAYLNRACELACVPLAQYYAESPNGDLDLVWITYRPEAILDNPGSIPDALVYLDSVDNMTENQARSRALGW